MAFICWTASFILSKTAVRLLPNIVGINCAWIAQQNAIKSESAVNVIYILFIPDRICLSVIENSNFVYHVTQVDFEIQITIIIFHLFTKTPVGIV